MCPAKVACHRKHHRWDPTNAVVDLWNNFECRYCNTKQKVSMMSLATGIYTHAWAGPCPGKA